MGVNKDLGLPFGGMEKIAICFDVDGTLIDADEVPTNTVGLLRAFIKQPWKNVDIFVWSGGGAGYAETMVRRILSEDETRRVKFLSKLDWQTLKRSGYYEVIAIDDIQDTAIGDANLIVRNK